MLMQPQGKDQRRGLKGVIALILAGLGIVVYEIIMISPKFIPLEYLVYVMLFTIGCSGLSVFELWYVWRGWRNVTRKQASLETEETALQARRAEMDEIARGHEEKRKAAQKHLQEYINNASGFIILDCSQQTGAVDDQICAGFRSQRLNDEVFVISGFDSTQAPFSLEHILLTKQSFQSIKLLLIDTKLPYAATEQIGGLIRNAVNTSICLLPLRQIFDPIVIFSDRLILSIAGKCIIVPTKGKIEEDPLKELLRGMLSDSIRLHPDYSKKVEYFAGVLQSFARDIVEMIRENGYSFSATKTSLWFVEPWKMSTHRIQDIKNEMDRHFKSFSEDILPRAHEIIANWPLTAESDLSLITSPSIRAWIDELQTAAADPNQMIRRYFYISAYQEWDGDKNVIKINWVPWKDRQTGEERGYQPVVDFLRSHFGTLPNNYKVYVVFVPLKPKPLFDHLLNFASQGPKSTAIDADEIFTNWIIFNCERTLGLKILQYEQPLEYEPEEKKIQPFYAFYYDDIASNWRDRIGNRRVDRYLKYSELLLGAADDAQRKLNQQPSSLTRGAFHILPIERFFHLIDQGQVLIEPSPSLARPIA